MRVDKGIKGERGEGVNAFSTCLVTKSVRGEGELFVIWLPTLLRLLRTRLLNTGKSMFTSASRTVQRTSCENLIV